MVPTVLLLALIIKMEILALSQELRQDKNKLMDIIWNRNLSKSEAIGRCGEDEKRDDDAEPTQLSAKQ